MGFSCGVGGLDRYFQEQVTQDMRRRTNACFIALDEASDRIAGYYTQAAGSVALTDNPDRLAKRLPRYSAVPVARLGRLAVDELYRGKNSGPPFSGMQWPALPVLN